MLSLPGSVFAQKLKWLKTENDTAYISDFTKDLTVRTFVANKFAKYSLGEYSHNRSLSYMANDNYNLGVGINYKYIGLNIGFKMPFINNDAKKYGETKFFDAQSYIYLRKVTVDLYVLSYNGYYLASRSALTALPTSNVYPQRPDLSTRNVGLNTQYIFNSKRFSFRSAYLQNEYQKKSAGSVLVGAGLHGIWVRADSAIIPRDIRYSPYFGNSTFSNSNILSLALNAGYAHTFVIKKYYFITAALMGGTGINYTTIENDTANNPPDRVAIQLNGIVRLAAGYSSTKYFVGIQYINFINRNNAPVAGTWQEFQAGNIRFTFAKRIKIEKKMRTKINKIENSIKSELGIPDGPK